MGRLGDHLLDSRTPVLMSGRSCNGTDGTEGPCNGHCCDGKCCNYYEQWWFWLILGVIVLLSFCCIYHQRQKRIERRTNRRIGFRNDEPYAGACNYPGPPLDDSIMGFCKLPVYKDVIRIPPTSSPPPPYSSRRRSIHTVACLQPNERGETTMTIIPCHITSSMLSIASLSHYIPELLAQNSIPAISRASNRDNEYISTDDNNNHPINVVQSAICKENEYELPEKITPLTAIDITSSTVDDGAPPTGNSPGGVLVSQADGCGEGCSHQLGYSSEPDETKEENYRSEESDDDDDDELSPFVDSNNNNPVSSKVSLIHTESDGFIERPPKYTRASQRNESEVDHRLGGDVVLHLSPNV